MNDASGVNAPLSDGAGNHLVNIPAWRASTVYPQGYVVQNGGVAYMATTTFTSGASFGADGSNWAPLSSAELGYAQVTSGTPGSPYINSSTPIALPGLSVTVTVASRPIEIELFGLAQNLSTNAVFGIQYIYEDGVKVQITDFNLPATQFAGTPMLCKVRRNPPEGSHTYTAYGSTSNASEVWFVAARPSNPAYLRVTQV